MAELQQILGSILRDIAQARFTSDLYSRNISTYYETDPLLRRFPAPRVDINEIEVDLKFVLSGLEQTTVQDEGREASIATIFITFCKYVSETFFDILLELGKEYANFSSDTATRFAGGEYRIYLRQDLLVYFQRGRNRLIKEGKYDYKEALEEINRLLNANMVKQLGDSGLTDQQQKELGIKLFEKLNIEYQLKSMREPIEEEYKDNADFKVAVEVTIDKLAETPESAISTVKIKAQVRNYMWYKVEHEGETWRQLNPE